MGEPSGSAIETAREYAKALHASGTNSLAGETRPCRLMKIVFAKGEPAFDCWIPVELIEKERDEHRLRAAAELKRAKR